MAMFIKERRGDDGEDAVEVAAMEMMELALRLRKEEEKEGLELNQRAETSLTNHKEIII